MNGFPDGIRAISRARRYYPASSLPSPDPWNFDNSAISSGWPNWAGSIARTPRDLAGQHAVVVGWGAIGQRIGALLRALGLTLTVVRHSATPVADARHTATYDALAAGRW
ncbi:NAD(P)-dependent oxidoreductase [Achromobacter spanius]|uniref:NAD(P)-dependent oxidoreductase n=1 Tax=Achromobacter spanius TaxID=217203 RepID=UPI003D15FF7A